MTDRPFQSGLQATAPCRPGTSCTDAEDDRWPLVSDALLPPPSFLEALVNEGSRLGSLSATAVGPQLCAD